MHVSSGGSMNRNIAIIISFILISAFSEWGRASQPVIVQSRISSVKLFTNKAEITRISKIKLEKGLNIIQIEGLPDNLYDWSARGSLPEKYNGKILSMEISRQALLEKRKKKIVEIEKKLEELKDKDADLADDLANIMYQEEFLNSVNDFAKLSASKELVTRLPQTEVWSSTMDFTSSRRKGIQSAKRAIYKKRRDLAAEIQKWEFELTQIAGRTYFSNYKSLKQAVEKNTISNQIQQYGDFTEKYAQQKGFLETDTSQIDTEKKILLNIFSASEGETEFVFTYMIPDTYWMMKYDFRASKKNDEIEIILYSDIYQKTGEDWDNINLSLSTGAPLTNIALPTINPWYISASKPYKDEEYRYASKAKKEYAADKLEGAAGMNEYAQEEAKIPETSVKEAGLYLEISFPLKQTIESSEKYQKKYIKSYTVKASKGLKYFYQTIPASSGKVFLMARTVNQTELPWLGGEAQVFLENEFIGKVNVPETPVSKEKELVLGIVPDTSSKKELVKKYEDTSGVFGGNKRIVYSYKITIENNSKETREVVMMDDFPVPVSEEVKVEIKDLSYPFIADDQTKKSTEYAQGIRKFILTLAPGAKKEIMYDAVITCDKEMIINGLR
jgi:uncharacterized protein (TIGR02231 family)